MDKLFQVSSNFASDPITPAKQWEEFQEISGLVERVREIESGHSMCRTLPDRRSAVKPFTAWLEGLGADIKKVCKVFRKVIAHQCLLMPLDITRRNQDLVISVNQKL